MKLFLVNRTKNALHAIEKSLKNEKFEISSMSGYEDAVKNIENFDPQIVVINWGKEDYDLAGLCKKIRRIRQVKYIYIIIIASREKQMGVSGILDAGADDFIFRPFGEEELALRVKKARKIILLEDKVVKSKKKLMKLAKEDPLTNLYNRRALLDEALKEMGRSTRESKFLSAILVSLSNFEDISESYGGVVGKAVLMEVGNRLKVTCRPYDKIGRYNITDFLVILPDSGITNAEKVAGRILSSVTDKPLSISKKNIDVSVGIGISEMDPADVTVLKEDHEDDILMNDLLLDSLIKRAEVAAYKAIKNGENNIEIALK